MTGKGSTWQRHYLTHKSSSESDHDTSLELSTKYRTNGKGKAKMRKQIPFVKFKERNIAYWNLFEIISSVFHNDTQIPYSRRNLRKTINTWSAFIIELFSIRSCLLFSNVLTKILLLFIYWFAPFASFLLQLHLFQYLILSYILFSPQTLSSDPYSFTIFIYIWTHIKHIHIYKHILEPFFLVHCILIYKYIYRYIR